MATAVDPAALPDGVCPLLFNCVNDGGVLRMDARYLAFGSGGVMTAQGAGYGRFEGTNIYGVAAGNLMWKVDADGVFSQVLCLGSIPDGDFWFQQFDDRMYFGNEEYGIGFFEIVGDECGKLELPDAPTAAPTVSEYGDLLTPSFSGGSLATSASAGTINSSTLGATYGFVNYTGGPGVVTFTFTFSAGNRPVLTYRDVMIAYLETSGSPAWGEIAGTTWYYQDSGGTNYPLQIVKILTDGGNATVWLQAWPGIPRANRTSVYKVSGQVPLGTGSSIAYLRIPRFGKVWLSTPPTSTVFAPERLEYCYTYLNSVTGFESLPSPSAYVEATAQDLMGNWKQIQATGSAEDGVDKIRYYRVIRRDGVAYLYRLDEKPNSSLELIPAYDQKTVTEVEALDRYVPSQSPGVGCTAMGCWENRLVIANGSLVYISREGLPLEYEPLSGAFDPFDDAQGLTFYPDDKRAEKVLALIGQDDLFIATDLSVRRVVGSVPSNWRLVKCPGMEGICGPRAACPFLNGILCLTPSGKLLYHDGGEPQNLGADLLPRLGDDGLLAYATEDAVVSCAPDGKVHVRSGTAYLVREPDGSWRSGEYADSTLAMVAVSGEPLRFLDTDSTLQEMSNAATDDNGAGVLWRARSRTFVTDGMTAESVDWGASVESTDALDAVIYPRMDVTTERTRGGRVKVRGKRHMQLPAALTGEQTYFEVSGDKDTRVHLCEVVMTPSGPARHK